MRQPTNTWHGNTEKAGNSNNTEIKKNTQKQDSRRGFLEKSALVGATGLGIDPSSSEIYVADAIDFVQLGVVYRFLPYAIPVVTYKVNIIPRAFCFKP